MKKALLLHTGFGKTKLCLDFIMKSKEKLKVLVISTKKIVQTAWSEEIDKWYPGQLTYTSITGDLKPKERREELKKDVDILGINTELIDWFVKEKCDVKYKRKLKNGMKTYYKTEQLPKMFDFVIFDESSLFKNSQSNRFKLVKSWVPKVKHVFTLSATPTPKNIEDIWAQIYLLDGGKRLGKNITEFRGIYAITIPLPNGFNRYQYPQESIDEILRLIQDIVISVPESDKELFPLPKVVRYNITPNDKTRNIIEEIKREYIVDIGKQELVVFSKNQLINKVNQIANGNVYVDEQTLHISESKINAFKYLIKDIDTPVLVPYVYKFDKESLLKLPGARLLDKPQDFKDWNNNKIKIGVISPSSAAHGLNLQHSDCQNVIWFSPIWDTEKWIQTNARVCRRGQIHEVTIGVLLLKGSFDHYMFNLCLEKFELQRSSLEKLS